MTIRLFFRHSAAILLLAASGSAWAHPFHNPGAGFVAGFVHPFAGLDHLLAMIAVGLWAAQFRSRMRWIIPAVFVTAMLAGGGLGFSGLALPGIEPLIATSVLALGLFTLLQARLHAIGLVLVVAFALFHGIAHGQEIPAATGALPYAVGFALATALLHAAGLGAALLAKNPARWAGAPIALAGGWLLLGSLI